MAKNLNGKPITFDVHEYLRSVRDDRDTFALDFEFSLIFNWCASEPHKNQEVLQVPELGEREDVDDWWLMILKQSQSFLAMTQIETMYASSAVFMQTICRHYGEVALQEHPCFALRGVAQLFMQPDYRQCVLEEFNRVNGTTSELASQLLSPNYMDDEIYNFRYYSPEITWIEQRNNWFNNLGQHAIGWVAFCKTCTGPIPPEQLAEKLCQTDGALIGWLLFVSKDGVEDYQGIMSCELDSDRFMEDMQKLIAGQCYHRDIAAYNLRQIVEQMIRQIDTSDMKPELLPLGMGWHRVLAQAEAIHSAFSRPIIISDVPSESLSMAWMNDVDVS